MAKLFVAASSQQYSATAAPITALPCTIACWFRTQVPTGTTRTMVSLDTAAGSARVSLRLDGTNALVAAQADAANTLVSGTVGTTLASTWHHGAAVFTSNTSRTAYLDGVAGSANTTSNTFTAPNSVRIGARVATGTAGDYMGGRVAEVGVWSAALTASEIQSLASGISPLMVRPQSLVFYAPLSSDGNPYDWVGGVALTPTNAPTNENHPLAVVYPFQPRALIPAATAPTISSPGVGGFGLARARSFFGMGYRRP